jgi:ADP-ribose pyrophosphatase
VRELHENLAKTGGVKDKDWLPCEYIRHGGGVAVAAIDQDKNVIMGKQYRFAVDEEMFELPGGQMVDKSWTKEVKERLCATQRRDLGADRALAENVAKKEFQEETGLQANTWHHLGVILPCVGYSTERIHLFMATDLRPGKKEGGDEGEMFDSFRVPLATAVREAESPTGCINDPKTVLGLTRALRKLEELNQR